jgi:hypothetical protein
VWDPKRKCSVAKVVYNFGRADQVDPESLRRLAKSIQRVFGEGCRIGHIAPAELR